MLYVVVFRDGGGRGTQSKTFVDLLSRSRPVFIFSVQITAFVSQETSPTGFRGVRVTAGKKLSVTMFNGRVLDCSARAITDVYRKTERGQVVAVRDTRIFGF